MIKHILKVFTHTFIAFYFTQQAIDVFNFGGSIKSVVLVLLFLFFLNLFVRSIIQMISLPDRGPVYFVLYTLLTALGLFICTAVIPQFSLFSLDTSALFLIGHMLPSIQLSGMLAILVSALLFSLLYRFLVWVTGKK